MTKRRLAHLGHVWLLIPWIGVVLAGRRPIRDNSFLWHVEAGRLQAQAGEVLTSDPFSSNFAGQPWRTQSWLLELIYEHLAGPDLTNVAWIGRFVGITVAVVVVAVGVAVYQNTRSVRVTAGLLVLFELLALPYFVPRPVVVSYALLALLIVVLRTPRLRWTIPLLMWVWAAMHGSFVLGGGLIILDGLARRDKRRIVDAVAAGVAVTLTAHGWRVWEILVTFLRSSDSLNVITEWAPPDILSLGTLPYTALLVGILVLASKGRIQTPSLWVIVPFLIFGLSTVRALMPAAIVLVVWFAAGLKESDRATEFRSLAATAVAAVLLVGPSLVPIDGASRIDDTRFPVAAASVLDANAPVFHDDVVGGYLIYRGLYPVLLDDRAELYSREFLESVIHTRQGRPLWRDFMEEHQIEQALIRSSDGLNMAFDADGGWGVVFTDDEFTVWKRR